MRTFKIVGITILSLGFLLAAALFFIGYFKPKPGGILISSQPAASVYVDGKMVGKTPYEGTYESKAISIDLVPEEDGKNYEPYKTRVTLVSGVKTVIRREFAEGEGGSSGDIVYFEKERGKTASLVVFADPDNSQVFIDGTAVGFTPYKSGNVTDGEHQVAIKSSGYIDRGISVRALTGYKLTIFVELAKVLEESKVEAVTSEIKTFIEILDTPTGFLRVRSEPGSAGREIHQAKPGEKYLFLEEDTETGWYKIQLEAPTAGLPNGRDGWVSNEYSKKIEEEVNINPTQIPATDTPE
jgi:hypothetical protein